MHPLKPGLTPGLVAGMLLGVLVAGPNFQVWNAATSVQVILVSALVGGIAGRLLVALMLAEVVAGPPTVASDDEPGDLPSRRDACGEVSGDPSGEVSAD